MHCGVVLSLGSRGGIPPKTGDKSPLEAIATASGGWFVDSLEAVCPAILQVPSVPAVACLAL